MHPPQMYPTNEAVVRLGVLSLPCASGGRTVCMRDTFHACSVYNWYDMDMGMDIDKM